MAVDEPVLAFRIRYADDSALEIYANGLALICPNKPQRDPYPVEAVIENRIPMLIQQAKQDALPPVHPDRDRACVLVPGGECLAKIPEACMCARMPKDVYLHCLARINGVKP